MEERVNQKERILLKQMIESINMKEKVKHEKAHSENQIHANNKTIVFLQ